MTNASMFPSAVYAIWWVALILTFVVFIPLSVYLLHRTWSAARGIQRYAAESLAAAAGIAENTQHISALDATIGVASQILATAGNVAAKLGTVADVLEERAR
ncbi:MAG: hypothetical protein M3Z30_07850 [Gemmatimonadota bacterium]|nr:hypothetical protein [Gemmatimonadota bacterium]